MARAGARDRMIVAACSAAIVAAVAASALAVRREAAARELLELTAIGALHPVDGTLPASAWDEWLRWSAATAFPSDAVPARLIAVVRWYGAPQDVAQAITAYANESSLLANPALRFDKRTLVVAVAGISPEDAMRRAIGELERVAWTHRSVTVDVGFVPADPATAGLALRTAVDAARDHRHRCVPGALVPANRLT